MIPFDYVRPRSLAEALTVISEHRSACRIIAGGTDLLIELRCGESRGGHDLRNVRRLLDVSAIPEMSSIRAEEGMVLVGAACAHQLVASSPLLQEHAPLLCQVAGQIGSPQVRNLGTVGGNLANASPAADLAAPLLALGAQVTLSSRSETRTIPLDSFYLGPYRTVMDPDEILTEILFPEPAPDNRFAFYKIGRRAGMTKARMNCAVLGRTDDGAGIMSDVRIACGSVTPVPRRIEMAESLLRGERASESLFRRAGEVVSEEMIRQSGSRWSTPYKKPVIEVMVSRALSEAFLPSPGGYRA